MPDKTASPEKAIACTVNAQVDRGLLFATETLRMAIQGSLTTFKVISRGDIIRLALRKLYLSYLLHLQEQPNPPPDLLETWSQVVADLHLEKTCPPWLFPGEGEQLELPKTKTKTPKNPKTKKEE